MKLNLIRTLRNPKKFVLIYGKLLKSDVIRGRDEVKIIYINLLKNYVFKTRFNFYKT